MKNLNILRETLLIKLLTSRTKLNPLKMIFKTFKMQLNKSITNSDTLTILSFSKKLPNSSSRFSIFGMNLSSWMINKRLRSMISNMNKRKSSTSNGPRK